MEFEQIFLQEPEESSAKTEMKRLQKNQIIYFFKIDFNGNTHSASWV